MGREDRPRDEEWWERELLKHERDSVPAQERIRIELRQGSWRGRGRPPAAPPHPAEAAGPLLPDVPETDDEEFRALAAEAREFALAVSRRDDFPDGFQDVRTAALRVPAHLEGGHRLGYDDDSLCGNVVKCRWALADARYCQESLEFLVSRRGRPEFAGLLARCRQLLPALETRVRQLQERVWW